MGIKGRLRMVEEKLNKQLPKEITWLICQFDGAEVTREEIEEAKRQYQQQHPDEHGIAVLDFCHLAKKGGKTDEREHTSA